VKKIKISQTIVTLVVALVVGGLAGALVSSYLSNYLIDQIQSSALNQHILSSPTKEISQPVSLEPVKQKTEEESVVRAVEKVSPAVVNIVVSKYVSKYYGENFDFTPDDFFNFDWPFGFKFSFPEKKAPEEKKEKQEVGGGTGFVIFSKDGLVLTNKHVVTDKEAEYTVVANDGEKYKAEVLARDPFNDVAILKVEKLNLPEVKLGDSDKISIGQTVIAIGNALGEYRNTITRGVISGVGRKIVAGSASERVVLENVIQTDAAINLGNSGGPLINLRGEVIGINTAVNLQGQLIGFALPINQAKTAIESVKKTGKISRPFLGVRYIVINKGISERNNLSVDYGALIIRGQDKTELAVIPGSPADKADLRENDIILEINGQKITEKVPLAAEIRKHKVGDKIKLKVLSKGKEKIVEVTLEEYKE